MSGVYGMGIRINLVKIPYNHLEDHFEYSLFT